MSTEMCTFLVHRGLELDTAVCSEEEDEEEEVEDVTTPEDLRPRRAASRLCFELRNTSMSDEYPEGEVEIEALTQF